MYNKILILLISISLVLLLNNYSLFLQESGKIKQSNKNLNKKVRFNLNNKNNIEKNIDTFTNKKFVNPYSNRPQNSNDYILKKKYTENNDMSDMEAYIELTKPEFLEMEGENIESAFGTPYDTFQKINVPNEIVYSSIDKDLLTNINFNYDMNVKPYNQSGNGSLFK
jgi:hypothetical protein